MVDGQLMSVPGQAPASGKVGPSWVPPPGVTEHQGSPLATETDFFVEPPADIGPIRTAHTSLKKGVVPKSAIVRMGIALGWGVALESLLLMADHVSGFPSAWLGGSTDPPLALVLVPFALLASSIAWFKTRFRHTCSYVGADGCAQFTCKRRRENIGKLCLFQFKDATSMVARATHHHKNTAYTHTTFGFFWYVLPREKPVFELTGLHHSGSASPPPGDLYHFCRSAESSWYQHLAVVLEDELRQTGRVIFRMKNATTVLGPGFIEITDNSGKLSRFVASEIGNASLDKNILQIARPGVELKPFDYSSREGVSRFDQIGHNMPAFRHFFERCLGIRI